MMRTAYELQVTGKEFSFPVPSFVVDGRPIVKKNHDGFNLLQNSCYRFFYCRSFCLRLAKRAPSNYKSFLGTTSFFKRQTLFISRFVWVNYRFDSGSLSSGVRRGISFSVLSLNQFANYLRFHSFLRVLGWDFLRDSQILPSTAEASARRLIVKEIHNGFPQLFFIVGLSSDCNSILFAPAFCFYKRLVFFNTMFVNQLASSFMRVAGRTTSTDSEQLALVLKCISLMKSPKCEIGTECGTQTRQERAYESNFYSNRKEPNEYPTDHNIEGQSQKYCYKACLDKFHFFLRVLGWDFLRDTQILPSTAEASDRGRRENDENDDISRLSVNYDSRLSIRSTKEEYSLDRLVVSGNDTVPGVLCDKRLCPSNNRGDIAIRFIRLFLWFSATIFFTQISRMDRYRIYSIFSANAPSLRPYIHSFSGVRVRFRTLLLGLTFFIPHFSNSHRREQSAKHGHCRAQKIGYFWVGEPSNCQEYKNCYQEQHKFIDGINFHSFLRVLGWDFLRDSQILPSTAEASARRIG